MKDYLEGFVGDEDPMEIWNAVFLNELNLAIYNRVISIQKIPAGVFYDFSSVWSKDNE